MMCRTKRREIRWFYPIIPNRKRVSTEIRIFTAIVTSITLSTRSIFCICRCIKSLNAFCVTHKATRTNHDDDKTKIHPPREKRISIDVVGGIIIEKRPSQKRRALGFDTVIKSPSENPEMLDLVVSDVSAETRTLLANNPLAPKWGPAEEPPKVLILS